MNKTNDKECPTVSFIEAMERHTDDMMVVSQDKEGNTVIGFLPPKEYLKPADDIIDD